MNKNTLLVIFASLSILLLILLIFERTKSAPLSLEGRNTDIQNETSKTEDAPEKPIIETRNRLDLSNKGLSKLPAEALSNTRLEELDISNNNISGALPGEIRHLQNLKILNASNNKMTGVPAEVGQLSELEILDLSNNQLTGLPYELGNLKKLRMLNLSGNSYAKQDLEVIKKGLPASTEIIL